MNIHIHPVTLDHASRILKCLESAGRSGCFDSRSFIGAGAEKNYQITDASGNVQVRLFPRASGPRSRAFMKLAATLVWGQKVKAYASKLPLKCINVHGLSTLRLGVTLKRRRGCKLIYDTHELETKVLPMRGLRGMYSERFERTLISYCDAVICVSDGIADWYAKAYGIPRPLVVRNVPDRRSQIPTKAVESLRTVCRISPTGLLFLYQGGLSAGRQIELFVEVFARLSAKHHLVFMGRGEMEDLVRHASAKHSNIHLCPPVPPKDVLSFTTQADVGLVGMENTCLNHYLSLPNKFFEYLTAGVPVVIPDFPEMRRVIDNHRCGWSWSGGVAELSALFEKLSADEIREKRHKAMGAGKELSWQKEEQHILHLYHRLLN